MIRKLVLGTEYSVKKQYETGRGEEALAKAPHVGE